MKQKELAVITNAKDLCGYVLQVTDSSPKRFRFTLVSRLQNYALDVVERLICANEVFVAEGREDAARERQSHQRRAMTRLKLLGYMAQIALERGCILPKQYERITRGVYDVQNMLGAWMASDVRRFGARR